jgi:hypothetical protein
LVIGPLAEIYTENNKRSIAKNKKKIERRKYGELEESKIEQNKGKDSFLILKAL